MNMLQLLGHGTTATMPPPVSPSHPRKTGRGNFIEGEAYRRALLIYLASHPEATADRIADIEIAGRRMSVAGVKWHLDILKAEGLIVTRQTIITPKGKEALK